MASQQPPQRTYDPRYHYPPPPPPQTGRSVRLPRSPNRKRATWPPQPSVEDEAASLAREAGSAELLKDIDKDEAGSRGTIDQDPLIQDVPEYMNVHERRFVIVPEGESGSGNNLTPPTSDDEKARRGRRNPSKIKTNIDLVPDISTRTASPYSWTKPTMLPTNRSSGEFLLSPDNLTPPATDSAKKRSTRYASGPIPSSHRDSLREKPRSVSREDYLTAGSAAQDNAIEDSDLDSSDTALRRNHRKPSRYSFKKSDLPRVSPNSSVQDFADQTPTIPAKKPPLNLESRRHTDTASTFPRVRYNDKARRPTPLMASSALNETVHSMPTTPRSADTYPPTASRSSDRSSRPSSPVTSSPYPPSPPRSPRLGADRSREHTPTSSQNSRPTSAEASRPSSPQPAKTNSLPQTDVAWSALMAANAARKAKPPSRLSASMRQDSVPIAPRVNLQSASPARHASTLPYPEDDYLMPSEKDHQFFHDRPPTFEPPPAYDSRQLPTAAPPALSTSPRTPIRPNLPARHSFAAASPTTRSSSVRPHTPDARNTSFSSTAQARKEALALVKKPIPPCPRPVPVHGHDDWYTISGSAIFDICPDCMDAVFGKTIYRPLFRRSPPRSLNANIKCDFSSLWMRLAWLMTLQQQRPDLSLLKDLASVSETGEPCPGNTAAVRSWYGILDKDGYLLRDFAICYTDVRKIERLLPTLSSLFVRIPHRASYEKRICSFRTSSNRFSPYLDCLIAIHEKALATHKLPDPTSFISLVRHKTRLRECTKDDMIVGQLWHFSPSMPSFTICEDCFEEIVEHEIGKNSDVAMRFNRTIQPVYGEGRLGSSCQLYSPRMRKVFKRAVEDNDVKYLARRVHERHEVEVGLQERVSEIRRKGRLLEGLGGRKEEDEKRRLRNELEAIAEEWAEWE